MRHSGNTGTAISESYGGEGVTLKIYVHDELGRFVTVAGLSFGLKDLERYVSGVKQRRADLDTMPLFDLEEATPPENVRWLPPQP